MFQTSAISAPLREPIVNSVSEVASCRQAISEKPKPVANVDVVVYDRMSDGVLFWDNFAALALWRRSIEKDK